MKDLLFGLLFVSIIITMSCGDGNVVITPDPAIQAAEDSAVIVNYLFDKGFEAEEIGVLSTGVRYVILDSGNRVDPTLQIDESDIVTYHYVGKLTNDTIFDTSNKLIADSIRTKVAADTVGKEEITDQLILLSIFSESRTYAPFTYTYSSSGWTLSSSGFITGYSDGISATLNKLSVDGTVLLVIPSGEAYGTRGSGSLIPPNTVIAFEISPIKVKKQQ